MPAQGNNRRALAWQAALVCLPIALLAGLGGFYLRQDRVLVRHEAEERARTLAGELSDRFWRELTSSAALSKEHAFRIDAGGALLFPVPFEKAPAPHPLDLERLAPEQAQAWSNPRPEPAALRQLLETELPVEFQALASYRMGLVLEGQNKIAEAATMFRLLYEKYPESVGETGLPLAPLAGLKAVELASPAGELGPLTWDVLCRDAIARPSVLTSLIIERAARAGVVPANRIAAYREEWQTHETLRELYRASRPQLNSAGAPPPLFWVQNAGDRWLVSRVEESATNLWLVCRKIVVVATLPAKPRGDLAGPKINRADETRAMRVSIGAKPESDLKGRIQILPEHLAPGLVVANEVVIPAPNAPVLATAAHTENGREWLRVSLHLISPESLYARQGQRVLWFGGLIAASSLAAAIGLISAWRNFEKQHRLAELKDNFVSSVSHELRAPIASVRLMAEALERGRVQNEHKQQEYYHFIVQECQRLSALTQNVLDFSRIDQGRKEYEFESADVLRLVDETVKAMQLCAAERQIHLRMAAATPSVHAVIDARAIQQALVNLIDNAIKHSSPGSEVTITVSTLNTSVPSLLLSVEDDGEGIPEAEHERIFERFYRIGSELRRQTPGAGIGLSIVKHVVAAHGGRVRVESEPGKGSRFTIQIPLKG
jgi:signal transduction histidine kinase